MECRAQAARQYRVARRRDAGAVEKHRRAPARATEAKCHGSGSRDATAERGGRMSQFLRDALLELLFREMAEHVNRGLDYDEALILGVEEIKRQIRGSRLDLAS